MQVIEVAPKDIHVLIDFSLKELVQLKLIMDNMTFNMDSSAKEHIDADKFLHEILYTNITELIKELAHGS